MKAIWKSIATICSLAAAGFLTAIAANTPTISNELPLAQPVPLPEQLQKYPAPAMSLADIPPTPAEAAGGVPRLTIKRSGGVAHIMPTIAAAAARKAAAARQGTQLASPPLLYHGGPVMYPNVQIYTIFWRPSSLQNGSWTGFSPKYVMINYYLAAFIGGHGIQNIATQYYQTIGRHDDLRSKRRVRRRLLS